MENEEEDLFFDTGSGGNGAAETKAGRGVTFVAVDEERWKQMRENGGVDGDIGGVAGASNETSASGGVGSANSGPGGEDGDIEVLSSNLPGQHDDDSGDDGAGDGSIRLILKSKEMEEFKIKVKPVSCFCFLPPFYTITLTINPLRTQKSHACSASFPRIVLLSCQDQERRGRRSS